MVSAWFQLSSRIAVSMLMLLTGALYPVLLSAEELLHVRVVNRHIELGKPLRVTVSTPDKTVPLASLDLSPLNAAFVIAQREYEIVSPTGEQRLQLQLFALRPGETEIPVLRVNDIHSSAIPIRVSAAVDAKENAIINVETRLSSTTPWQRQQVIVTMHILSPAPILELQSNASSHADYRLLELDRHQTPMRIDGRSITRHTLRWALFPEVSGRQMITLPSVDYIRDGIRTHRFYFPPIDMSVRALPIYVPPTMPVGRLNISSQSAPSLLNLSERLLTWRLRIRGSGLSSTRLPDVSVKMARYASMDVYAARIERHDGVDDVGLLGEASFSIPFRFSRTGLLRLPGLTIQYFDPESAVIREAAVPAGYHLVVAPWVFYLTLAALTLVGVRYLTFVLRGFVRRLKLYRCYRILLHRAARASTARDLRACIVSAGEAEGWPPGLTVQQWYTRWSERRGRDLALPVEDLYHMLYGADTNGEITQSREALMRLFRSGARRALL